MGINLGGGNIGMTEKELDGTEICASFQEVGGKGMAQDVRGHLRGNASVQGVAEHQLPKALTAKLFPGAVQEKIGHFVPL